MTINISAEDTKLFEENGYTYSDVNNTVTHYRNIGLSDEEIQTKINDRINVFKTGNKDLPVIYTAPKRNLFTDMSNAFKWASQVPMSAFETSKKNVEIADLEMKGIYPTSKLTNADKQRLDSLQAQGSNYKFNAQNNYGIENPTYKYEASTLLGLAERTPKFLKKSYASTMEQLPILWEIAKSSGVGGAVGAVGGAVVGGGSAFVAGQLGPQAATPEEVVTVPTGMITGAKQGALWLGRTGAAKKVFELEAGLAKNELRQLNNEIIAEGGEALSEGEMNLFAIGVGGANAGFEYFSLNQMLKTVPGGKALLDKLKKNELKELVKNPTVREQMMGILKEYGKAVLTEGATEAAQEATLIVATERARKLGGLDATPLEKKVQRVLDAGMMGVGATLFLGAVGSVGQASFIMTKQGMSPKAAKEKAESMSDEERHLFVQEHEDILVKEGSKQFVEKQNVQNLQNAYYEQMKNMGIEEDEATSTSSLMANSFNQLAKQLDMDVSEIEKEANIQMQNLTVEEAQNQWTKDNEIARAQLSKDTQFQSAMYKSPKKTFEEFYEQVQKNKTPKQKAYFTQKISSGINVDIFHDIVRHDEKKHSLSKVEWNNLFNAIDNNIEDKRIAAKSYYRGIPLLLKVNVNGTYYGVSMEVFQNRNIITTAFKSTEKGLNEWFEKDKKRSARTTAPNHQSGSRIDKNNHVISGQTLSNIINDVKTKLKPSVNKHEAHFQLVNNVEAEFGDSVESITDILRADIENIIEENYLDESEFKLEDVKLYGSYTTGKNRVDSDLDVLVQYSGAMSEDGAFNMFAEADLSITDKTGHKVKVDINPIKADDSGTIDEYLDRNKDYIKTHFQSIGIFDKVKQILSKKENHKNINSIDDLIEIFPLFNRISDFFEDIKDVKMVVITDENNPSKNGYYSPKEDVFYLNAASNAYKNNPTSRILTILHELQHAKQKRLYVRYAKELKENKNLSELEKQLRETYIADYKATGKANRKYQDFKKKYKQELIKVGELQRSGVIDNPKFKKYKNIEWKKNFLYNDYYNSVGEVEARNIADELLNKLGLKEQYEYESTKSIIPLGMGVRTLSRLYGDGLHSSGNLGLFEVGEKPIQRSGISGIRQENEKEIRPYFQDVHTEESVNIKPIELQKDAVPNFNKVTDLKKWIEDNLNLLGDVQIKSNNRIVHFSKSNIGRSMKSINRNSVKRNSYAGLKELVENSVYSYTKEVDERHSKRNNGQEIYHNAFIYDGEIYGIEISIDIPKNTNTTHSYAGHKIKIIKKAPEVNGTKLPDLTGANISINDIRTLFNPNVNIGKAHFQSNTEENINDARGFTYQRQNFDGSARENLIVLLKNKADKSTLMHEFGHVYLNTLNALALKNAKAKELLITVNKYLRHDGGEYTVEQHEKFARGYTAYIARGKAPSYSLKKVFENFRKWLNGIYTDLQVSNDIELDNETIKVFETLLGDVTLDAQKNEASQIVIFARNNANIRFVDEAEKRVNINLNQLTPKQKRYRDTAYDIIWYAISHSHNPDIKFVKSRRQLVMILGNQTKRFGKRNKSIKLQAQKIGEFLADCDDVFSANDGFLPEWGEFFTDPGVSYNFNTGADVELALAALDVIENNKFIYDPDFVNGPFGTISEDDLLRHQYEFEYIIDAFKNADDKTIPMMAFFEWAEALHPYIQEDYVTKWESKTAEIERYEALSKWDQAKEDLKLYAAKMSSYGSYSSQFAEYAREIIKRLDFMTESDKERLFDKLREFNSFEDIRRNLDDVMDYAKTLGDMSERRQLARDIEYEVKATIHTWENGIKKTKYTYPANKLFETLRAINKMKMESIQDLYDAILNEEYTPSYEADSIHDEDYFKIIQNEFVKFKINGANYSTTEQLQDLLNRIRDAKFTAKVARDEADFERRMQAINIIDSCAKAVDAHKGKVSKIEKWYRHGFNLNSALEMIFNKEIKNQFSLDYLYAQKDARVGADRDVVLNKIADVWGYKGPFKNIQLFNRFINMTKKEFTIKQRYSPDIVNGAYRITHTDPETGKTYQDKVLNLRKDNLTHDEWLPELVELSRMEVLYYYIQSKNDTSYKILTDMGDETTPPKGQFDKFEFDELINNLTPQEKLMGDILQLAAEKYYPELNRYHIKKYHTELGKVNAYFPRKSETQDIKVLELFNDYVQFNTKQKFQKQRTAGPGIRIAPANPVAVLFDHIEKSNTLIVMGEQLDLMNKVFKDTNLIKKVKLVFGEEVAKEFMQQITSNLYSGQVSTISEAESFIASVENNVIKSQIFLKPQVGLKQVMSFMNYGVGDEFVSATDWWKKFGQQTFTPKEWKNNIKYMMNIPYLKDRFGRGGSTDALKRQLEQRMFAKISLFDEIFSANVRYGDMGAIILGGKPYIDCLLDKGYTEEQAIKIFIEKTVNDQQSSIPSTLSNIQRNAAKQPLAKMFFAYQNTPWQYFRTAANSIIRYKQNPNKQTALNMVKLTGLYLYVFPLLFNLASSLSPIQALDGDDEELKKDFWKSIIGGITFVPIAGMFINSIYSAFQGERASTGNWFDSAASKVGGAISKTKSGDITPRDLYNAISLFGEASTGVPMTTIGTGVTGVGDIVQGDIAKGLLKVGGYTDYRAKKITGEK